MADLSTTVQLRIPQASINYLIGRGKYTFKDIENLIKVVLTETLNTTIYELEAWINTKVPKRTGQMRYYLKQFLQSSEVKEHILQIILRSDLEYTSQLNEMATSQVRHAGEKGYVYYDNIFGIRGPILLYDPEAVGYFFDELEKYATQRIKINLAKAIMLYTITQEAVEGVD